MSNLLHSLVAARAELQPESIAIVMRQEAMTYGDLERFANRLARLLREVGCRRGDRVALLMPKAPRTVACMLAALKADCAYVPIDPSGPVARVQRILASCQSSVILAAGTAAPLLNALFAPEENGNRPPVGWMENEKDRGLAFAPDFSLGDVGSYSPSPPASCNAADDPAHILFTSGSTGVPKGVVITHSNVVHFVRWANAYFGVVRSDRNSGHSPLQFDLSTFDIYGTLAAGAQLHLVPPELNMFPNKLAEFIRSAGLTQWFSVPSVLSLMAKFDVVTPNDFPALKRLLWCGEVFPTANLIYWMKRLPAVSFTNLYGPTEATIASAYYPVTGCPADEKAMIPIGTGCGGDELLVLDSELRPVPPGQAGSLYIRGPGLSPGYWRDPEKTRAAFFPYPPGGHAHDRVYCTGDLARVGEDGLVYFLGRADTQIKSRGYRIELGEIETALSTFPDLRESAVVGVQTPGFEGTAICCAYVPAPSAVVSPAALRTQLTKLLPEYMLPTRWVALPALPLNGNGKIDRPKLRELFLQSLH